MPWRITPVNPNSAIPAKNAILVLAGAPTTTGRALAVARGCGNTGAAMGLGIEDFQHEIAAEEKSYDKFVV